MFVHGGAALVVSPIKRAGHGKKCHAAAVALMELANAHDTYAPWAHMTLAGFALTLSSQPWIVRRALTLLLFKAPAASTEVPQNEFEAALHHARAALEHCDWAERQGDRFAATVRATSLLHLGEALQRNNEHDCAKNAYLEAIRVVGRAARLQRFFGIHAEARTQAELRLDLL
ncbi:MAG: hypothetical protein MHM6MM_000408 [Cercozoa sp. M6MM]